MASEITQSSRRNVGLFGTHRGRVVLRLLLAAGAMSLGLLMLNGILNPKPQDPAAATATAAEETAAVDEATEASMLEAQKPEVASAVFDPFALDDDAQGAISMDRGAGPSVEWAEGTDEESAAEDDPLFGLAATTAAKTAREFATYSHEESAKEYVEGVTGLRSEMRDALAEASEKAWPGIQREEVSAVASPGGSQPLVTRFNSAEGTATVIVAIQQEVSGAKGDHSFARSYEVALMKTKKGDAWEVASIQG